MQNQTLTPNNFLDVVNASFFDEQENTRQTNEGILTSFMSSNPNGFVDLCTEFFADSRTPIKLRKTIGTVLKLAVKPLQSNFEMSIWNKITSKKKEAVKMAGLSCLVDPEGLIRKTAADLVADVFYLDCINDRSWSNLLPTLTSNLENENPIIQQSAIETLGFICEVLHKGGFTDLSEQEIDSMVSGICKKLNVGEERLTENTLIALRSLEYSLNFIAGSLQSPQMAGFIMNLVVNVLIKGNQQKNEEIILQSIICLNELLSILKDSFSDYLPIVMDKLFDSYSLNNRKINMALNDFFQGLIISEQFTKTISSKANPLIEKVIESLLVLLPEEMDMISEDEESDLLQSAVGIMSSINSQFLSETFENLMKFVFAFIDKKEILNKVAALTVIESIICSPGHKDVSDLIQNMFNGLNSFLSGQNLRLQICSANVMKNIALFYPRDFMIDSHFQSTMSLINGFLGQPARNPVICGHIPLIIDNLAEHSETLNQNEFALFAESLDVLLTRLFHAAENCEELHLIDRFYSTSMVIFSKVLPSVLYNKWFKYLWDKFMQIKNYKLDPKSIFFIESIFINLNVITQKMIMNQVNFTFTNEIDNFIYHIFEEICSLFQSCKEILVEPLLFLNSVFEKEPSYSQTHANVYLNNFISSAISDPGHNELFKAGISCLGDMVKIYGDQLRMYINQNFHLLLDNINNPATQEETKIRLFFTLSDIAAHCPFAILQRFEEILTLIRNAFTAVIILQDKPGGQEFSDALKETLIEFLLCIVHGIYFLEQDLPPKMMFKEFFPAVIDFGQKTTKVEYNPTLEYLRDFMMLITDYFMKENLNNIQNLDFPKYLYEKLSKFQENSEIREVLDNYQKIMKNGSVNYNRSFM